jgi:hypothetical protein
MKWRCAECERVYDNPPGTCVCGAANVTPDDGEDGRYSLSALRERLLDPQSSDRSLVRDEPYVAVAFRLLLALALLGAVVVTIQAFV